MEFFALADVRMDQAAIRDLIKLETLPELCASFESVEQPRRNQADVYSVWGRFRIHSLPIEGGVRFSMTDCPNGLTWSITTGFPPTPERVVVHAVINRIEHDPEFIDSLNEFVRHWKDGLENLARTGRLPAPRNNRIQSPRPLGKMKIFTAPAKAKAAQAGD